MNDRAPLRQYYDNKAEQAKEDKQYADRTVQLGALESNVIGAIHTLIRYMDGKTTKTEVVNQLKSISTPDVDKVVVALSKLDANILANKLDITPLLKALDGVQSELSQIPKSLPEFEQRETVTVDNLGEIKFDTAPLEKAIKGLKLDPTIDVKSPIVNVDAPDLKPLQDVMLDLLKAVKNQEFPAFPDIPKTDLAKVEKKLDESNKHLKAISEKRMGGGGGGGGNGSPYIDVDGTTKNVMLDQNGAIPVSMDSTREMDILEQIESAVQALATARGVVGDIRVTLVGGTASIGTVSTVTTVSTVANQTNMGGFVAAQIVPSNQNTVAVLSNINNIGA